MRKKKAKTEGFAQPRHTTQGEPVRNEQVGAVLPDSSASKRALRKHHARARR